MKHFFSFLLFLSACQNPPAPPPEQPAVHPVSPPADTIRCPGDLLETDTDTVPPGLFSPGRRHDICGWWMPEDTVTPRGNSVRYLISNDTCCRDYLYLEWGNRQFRNVDNLGCLRQFHPKMNPEYAGESKEYLFFESAGSGGLPVVAWTFWLFPLRPNGHGKAYNTVAPEAYDPKSLTIVREVENGRTDYHFVEAYNIRTGRVKPIRFKNRLSTACPAWAVDSVSITPRTIFLRMEVLDRHDEIITETVVLPNDIK